MAPARRPPPSHPGPCPTALRPLPQLPIPGGRAARAPAAGRDAARHAPAAAAAATRRGGAGQRQDGGAQRQA
eukprot:scaffold90055_cov42-Phaeocystis_antarctica.AAC.3